MEILTKGAEETKIFGRNFANSLKGGETLALVGGLGSGKTTFVQGLAEGLGIEQKIISPTFILLRQYGVKSNTQSPNIKNFYHLDLYRLEDNIESELMRLGTTDLWAKPENVVIIEWADKAKDSMPDDTVWIIFKQKDEVTRKITVR